MAKEQGQKLLFGEEQWRKEWQGMPEYEQADLMPWKSMTIHFASQYDLDDFIKLIGQKLTRETRFMWYPPQEVIKVAKKLRYADAINEQKVLK